MDEIKNIEDKFQLLIDIMDEDYNYTTTIISKDGYSNIDVTVCKAEVRIWKEQFSKYTELTSYTNFNRMELANAVWKDIYYMYTSQPKNKP